LKKLNEAYANMNNSPNAIDTKIQFCLARVKPDGTPFNGINYVQGNDLTVHPRDSFVQLRDTIYYPTDQYINVYIVQEIDDGNPTQITAGYASMPYPIFANREGVVIAHDYFGWSSKHGSKVASGAEGLVLVHEMGHYLGLYHPWRGGCSEKDCETQGDLCCDVPAIAQQTTQCVLPQISCNGGAAQKENYMDYSKPSCKDRFTLDQAEIMHDVLLTGRRNLWQPRNINRLKLECCQISAHFTGDNIICAGERPTFSAYKYEGASYNWQVFDQSGQEFDVASQKDFYNFVGTKIYSTIGEFDVKLTITFSGTSISHTINRQLEVIDCSKPVKDHRANWYFGENAGMSFFEGGVSRDIGPYNQQIRYLDNPNSEYPAIFTHEFSICQNDTNGNSLFYAAPYISPTGAVNNPHPLLFYKNNHKEKPNVQANGHGDPFAVQGGVSLKYPGRDSLYIVIHSQNASKSPNSISTPYYSVIKFIAPDSIAPLPDSVNVSLPYSSGSAQIKEGMTLVPKCGDTSFWLLMTEHLPANLNQLGIHLYSIDNNGIHYDRTIKINNVKSNTSGAIYFSPDASIFSLDYSFFTFDRKTGDVALFKKYDDQNYNYSSSFSSDGNLIYQQINFNDENDFGLFQVDPFAHNIEESRVRLHSDSSMLQSLKMGPDDRIYLVNYELDFVSVISQPNLKTGYQNECGYEKYGLDLAKNGVGGVGQFGVPNFRDADFYVDVKGDFHIAKEDCYSYAFIPNLCCAENFSWTFGDGSTSTDKSPSHTYTSNGSYTVQLIADGDTISKTIDVFLDTSLFPIWGPREYCDNTIAYQYETESLPGYSFKWTAKTTSNITSQHNWAEYTWSADDSLFLEITNNETGCIGVKSIGVTKEIGATISDSIFPTAQYICEPTSVATIENKFDAGGTTYAWYSKHPDSTTWDLIVGANSSTYTPTSITDDIQFICQSQNGCTKRETNISEVKYLTAQNHIGKIVPNQLNQTSNFGAQGELESFHDLVQTDYQWQIRKNIYDGGLWEDANQTLSEDSMLKAGLRLLQGVSNDNDIRDMEIRRIVSFLTCTDTSNIEKIVTAEPTGPFSDSIICTSSLDSILLSGLFTYDTAFDIRMTVWQENKPQKREFGGDNFITGEIFNSGSVQFKTPATELFKKYSIELDIRYYVFNSSNPQGGFHGPSRDFVIFVRRSTAVPSITTQPQNQTRALGQTASFNVTISGSDADDTYQWYVSSNNVAFTPIRGATGKTLTLSGVTTCQDGNYYRCIITNACGSTTSSSARLTISNPNFILDNSDLWMRDSPRDIGDEPNSNFTWNTVTQDVFRSPDIWNRVGDSTGLVHQNPEYKTQSDNYLRVRINNRGIDTNVNGRLKLYWTYGATGEIWDTSWLDIQENQFWNEDSAQFYPMGREITPPGGIPIPKVDTGSQVIITQAWRPPSTTWYYTYKNGVKQYDSTKVPVCFYARIEQCSDFPYGMTFQENYGQIITKNTAWNNNIATKNVIVVNNVRGDKVIRTGWTGIGRGRVTQPTMNVRLQPGSSDYFDDWEVYLEMDDEFYDAWADGGFLGQGFVLLQPNLIRVLNSEFVLTNVQLDFDQLAFVRPIFKCINELDELDSMKYVFHLSQEDPQDQYASGGFSYELDNENGQLARHSKLYKTGNETTNIPELTESFDWIVMPNPAQNYLDVLLGDASHSSKELVIHNAIGQLVLRQTLEKGQSRVRLDISGFAEGVYYINYLHDGIRESKMVVIAR
jgi:PKD repeat protein